MNFSQQSKLWVSVLFGVYQFGLALFFNPFRFIESEKSYWPYYLILLISTVIVELVILFLLIKNGRGKGINRLFFSGSFLFNGLFCGTILWLLFAPEFSHFFPHISAFTISSFLPTIVSLLLFLYMDATEKFSELSSVSLRDNTNAEMEGEKVFHLENANGKLLLEVSIQKIICFEANDNYVVTYFIKKDDEIGKSMERISLKKIEEMLKVEDVIFNRVHKSYLVNPIYVDEIKGRAQAYKLKLKHFNPLVPVSRSYNIQELNRH